MKFKKISLFFIVIFIGGLILGIFRREWSAVKFDNSHIAYYNDFPDKITLTGFIINVERKRERNDFVLEAENLQIKGFPQTVKGKVLIFGKKYPEIHYGEKIEITGKLMAPFNEGDFSFGNYLSVQGIYSIMSADNIEIIEKNGGFLFWRGLFYLRDFLGEKIGMIFTEPMAGLARGLLLGSKEGLSPELMEMFKKAGLIHIIAVSGYNIAMVILFLNYIFWFLNRKKRIPVIIIFIVLFVLLVGASASAVRAAIMGSITLIGKFLGRKSAAKRILFLTAFLMIFINPLILFYDAGFQLSFAATFGIVYLSGWFEKLFKKMPDVLCVKESLIMTLSAQLTTAPIIFWQFGTISWISPLTNVLAAPFIPLIMLLSAMALGASFVSIDLARLIGYGGWVAGEAMIWIAGFTY